MRQLLVQQKNVTRVRIPVSSAQDLLRHAGSAEWLDESMNILIQVFHTQLVALEEVRAYDCFDLLTCGPYAQRIASLQNVSKRTYNVLIGITYMQVYTSASCV
jgi:hypothetical protein